MWHGGLDANDPERLAALTAQLAPPLDPAVGEVKQALRDNTQAAIDAGLFGVPTLELEGRHYWGLDALPMLRDALLRGEWSRGPAWHEQGLPRAGVVRRG